MNDQLYAAHPRDVLDVVSLFDDSVQLAMVFTHNPAITELANRFSEAPIENVPTCGVLTIEASAWSRIDVATLVDFDYPKKV